MRNTKPIFFTIMLCIPLLSLVLIEAVLRMTNVGEDHAVFIVNPVHTDYLLPRPDILRRYFHHSAVIPPVSLEANFFLQDKPSNGLRIFVQGGSTAAGYPYGLGASLAGMLDHRLKRSLPQHHVEVVNTALSAVNSFTLLDIADDIISQQPDAVLIYAGHNEYLGILGVGSHHQISSHYWLTRAMLWLKSLRLYQMMQMAITPMLGVTDEQTTNNRRTVMSQVAKHKNIPFDSAFYQQGLTQFQRNMSALLDQYHDAGIPVFLSTIASNIKDQAPFESASLSDELKAQIEHSTQLSDLTSIIENLEGTYNAQAHYLIATQFLQLGDSLRAKQHFILARDYDLLRFRAPEAINHIIRSFAEYDNVTIVDSNAGLAQRSANGIIGNNVMLEHLHPNLPGYFVIANQFYQTIADSGLLQPFVRDDINQAWQLRPVLPSEEYYGFASIQVLTADYPFNKSPQPVHIPLPTDWQQALGKALFEKKIDWLTMAKQAAQGYKQRGNTRQWLKTQQLIADALPHDPLANMRIGELLLKQRRYAEAAFYLARAKRAGAIDSALATKIDFARERAQQSIP